jgi:hypothetical protein
MSVTKIANAASTVTIGWWSEAERFLWKSSGLPMVAVGVSRKHVSYLIN